MSANQRVASSTRSFTQSFTLSSTQSLNPSYITGSQSHGMRSHLEWARVNKLQPLLNHSLNHSLSHPLNHWPFICDRVTAEWYAESLKVSGNQRVATSIQSFTQSLNLSFTHSIIHYLDHSIIETFIYYRAIVAWCVESLRASGNQRVATFTLIHSIIHPIIEPFIYCKATVVWYVE